MTYLNIHKILMKVVLRTVIILKVHNIYIFYLMYVGAHVVNRFLAYCLQTVVCTQQMLIMISSWRGSYGYSTRKVECQGAKQ